MTRASPRPTRRAGAQPPAALIARGLGESRLAFGLAGLGGAWGPVDPGLARETLQLAFSLGIHVFDVAPAYGTAEALLGEALRTWRGPRPIVSTKVGRLPGRDALEMRYEHGSESLRDSLRRSLDQLGLPAVDLLFLHEPEEVPHGERARVADTLQGLRGEGLVHRLGLGGGDGPAWDGFIETGVFDVVMLFRRLDACIFDGLADEVPRLRRAGLATYGASPLHMGLLGSRHHEFLRERPEWVWTRPAARAVRLRELAEARGIPLSMLAHRFAFSLEELDRVVIGARSPAELQDAWAAFTAGPLPAELFDAVCAAHN